MLRANWQMASLPAAANICSGFPAARLGLSPLHSTRGQVSAGLRAAMTSPGAEPSVEDTEAWPGAKMAEPLCGGKGGDQGGRSREVTRASRSPWPSLDRQPICWTSAGALRVAGGRCGRRYFPVVTATTAPQPPSAAWTAPRESTPLPISLAAEVTLWDLQGVVLVLALPSEPAGVLRTPSLLTQLPSGVALPPAEAVDSPQAPKSSSRGDLSQRPAATARHSDQPGGTSPAEPSSDGRPSRRLTAALGGAQVTAVKPHST